MNIFLFSSYCKTVIFAVSYFWRYLRLKIDCLIYFMVSKINILTKFRLTICYTFIINCTNFEKMHGFSINMQ